ncbi:MAG: class II glutamine amidotransferase, partial [Desulfobacterales bacterium]|nr:class II glutamine amidotransferase [Desulfobacterales bacterium]
MIPSERPKDECGVFGLYRHPEAAKITYFGLYALQHRGQESAGISVHRETDGQISSHKGMGLVPDIFKMEDLERMEGGSAIGHVRYSTTGDSVLANAQPFVVRHRNKTYALAHNGNLVNAHILRRELEEKGSIFQTTMDSEVFLHMFIRSLAGGDFEQALRQAAERVEGAYSMVLLTSRGEVIGIKDPNGFRPLALGKLNGHYVLASETCAFDLVGAEFIRELDPGEIVIINEDGIKSLRHPKAAAKKSMCIFEYIYFARPDSTIAGHNVYQMRKAHGRRLAQEAPVEADLVMPFPDSGNYAAIG